MAPHVSKQHITVRLIDAASDEAPIEEFKVLKDTTLGAFISEHSVVELDDPRWCINLNSETVGEEDYEKVLKDHDRISIAPAQVKGR